MTENFLDRTRSALGDDVIGQMQNLQFCVVGCGGTGALFAEMLVRTGAQKITLVDGDCVEESNLNRVFSFLRKDIGKKKVAILKSRFEEINSEVSITAVGCHLRQHDPADKSGQPARDSVYGSDVVIMAMDNNDSRIICEDLCFNNSRIKTLRIGVYVNADGNAGFEVTWNGKTPSEKKEDEGYGIGSYASIVVEATATAFTMLLHHLKVPSSSDYNRFYKSYNNHVPDDFSRQ